MTSPLYKFVMTGQLTTPPFQAVFWTVYNTPDTTGLNSGYFGQLQNITVAQQEQLAIPSNAVPTIDANSIQGIQISNAAPSDGQTLVYDAGGNVYTPGAGSGGSQFDVTLHNGLNSNVVVTGHSTIRIGGPTAAFSIDGLSTLPGPSPVTFINTTAYPLTLIGTGSVSAFPLNTQSTGAPIVLQPKTGSFTVVGDQTALNCLVQNVGILRPTVFNVQDYGADPTGVADCTSAINATVLVADNVAGSVVYFPRGTYKITGTLNDINPRVSLVGDNYLTTVLSFTGATNGIQWQKVPYTRPVAGRIEHLKLEGNGTGLCALRVAGCQNAVVEAVLSDGWVRQGFLFQDTILSELKSCVVSNSCSTGYAAVEVDGTAGVGSTTFYWYNNNVTGNPNADAGLKIDRTDIIHIYGGTCEGSGVPIQIASKTEAVTGVVVCVIDGLDLETSGTTDHFIDVGYGFSGSSGLSLVAGIEIRRCTMFVGTTVAPYGIKFKNVHSSIIENNVIDQGFSVPGGVASIYYEGGANEFIKIGWNLGSTNVPYLLVNGVDQGIAWGKPWQSDSVAVGLASYGVNGFTLPKTSTPAFSQSAQTTDAATHDWTETLQGPWASASSNKSVGKRVFNFPLPVAGGTYGRFSLQNNLVEYLGITANGTKVQLLGPNTQNVEINAGNAVYLNLIAATQYIDGDTTNLRSADGGTPYVTANNSVFSFSKALKGLSNIPIHRDIASVDISAGNGDFALSAAQYMSPYIQLTGTIAHDVAIVFPTQSGADWIVDATGVTLAGHTLTFKANSVTWGTTPGVTNIYHLEYGGAGKLYGTALTP